MMNRKNIEFQVAAVNYSTMKQGAGANNIYIDSYSRHKELNDSAVFLPVDYKTIFGKTRKEDTSARKKLAVVRFDITYQSITTRRKRTKHFRIRRKYVSIEDVSGLHKGQVGLTPESIRLLSHHDNSDLIGKNVVVHPGNFIDKHCFYWFHPYHSVQISYRFAFISIIVGVVSIILTISTMSC